MVFSTDYEHPMRKSPSLHSRKSNPNPKFIGTAEANFVCHIGPKFQISLNYAFIGCQVTPMRGLKKLEKWKVNLEGIQQLRGPNFTFIICSRDEAWTCY